MLFRRLLGSFLQNIRGWRNSRNNPHPLLTIEISKAALLSNLQALARIAPRWSIAPALKSNAYGHGLVSIARILAQEKEIAFFCIDSYFEAETLRHAGINTPLLVMGYTSTERIYKNRIPNLSFMIGSLAQLEELSAARISRSVHIKFDTGMHRQGILSSDIAEAIRLIDTRGRLRIDGIMSHLADAETQDSALTRLQIQRWNGLVDALKKKFSFIRHYHLANSAGYAHAATITANVARPGIAIYGIDPGNLGVGFKPALRMVSRISDIRTVPSGESVGYNGTFIGETEKRIATIPAGYFEGIDRRLSNQGAFLIEGREAPICGRISMNMSSCDVTGIAGASPGSPITLISAKDEDKNSVRSTANSCATIPYEILIHLSPNIRRNVVESFE